MNRRSDYDRLRIANLIRQGRSYREIRDVMRCSDGLINTIYREFDLPRRASGGRPPTKPEIKQQVAGLLRAGFRYRTIAKQVRVSMNFINEVRKEFGIPKRKVYGRTCGWKTPQPRQEHHEYALR